LNIDKFNTKIVLNFIHTVSLKTSLTLKALQTGIFLKYFKLLIFNYRVYTTSVLNLQVSAAFYS